MVHKRGRRHTVDIPTNRPIPEPMSGVTKPIDGEFIHEVGFNLALFSQPEQRLIREELKRDGVSQTVIKLNMLYMEVRTKSRLPGDALLEASAALTSILTRLEESGWRPLRRVAAIQG